MKEPTLEDYGLTKEDIRSCKKYEEETVYWIFKTVIILGAVLGVIQAFTFVVPLGTPFHAVEAGHILMALLGGGFMALIGASCGLIVSLFVALIYHHTLPLFNKHIKTFREYKKAKDKFDAWFTRTQTEFWGSLTGKQFEHEFASVLSRNGYNIEKVAKGSGDGGVDIIAHKGWHKVIVQCKVHKNPVGPAVVRDLYGAMKHAKAKRAILACTSGFTKGVKQFAKHKPIDLINMNGIIHLSRTGHTSADD
ncbi:MAG: restriction endonuclease [Candidatus Brocadiales bacterium]|nr:restriction endonuclease [Candidatus Bathyanammoxibius amoris]